MPQESDKRTLCTLQVAEEVLAAAPPDDHVLNMLLLVLKPAQRAADLTAAYEAACSKQPNNQDLLEGLFACHVRCVVLLQELHSGWGFCWPPSQFVSQSISWLM